MNKSIVLTDEFLDAEDVMPIQGIPTDYISPAVYDIPREVNVSPADNGGVMFRFFYPDREEPSPSETPLDDRADVLIRRGQYSGKIMFLRAPAGKAAISDVSERLRAIAPQQKWKNQELNFLLLSNILRKKQDELQLV